MSIKFGVWIKPTWLLRVDIIRMTKGNADWPNTEWNFLTFSIKQLNWLINLQYFIIPILWESCLNPEQLPALLATSCLHDKPTMTCVSLHKFSFLSLNRCFCCTCQEPRLLCREPHIIWQRLRFFLFTCFRKPVPLESLCGGEWGWSI